MNTDDLAREAVLYEAERRVLKIQTKLHQWATNSPHRRFDDLFNLVADPAFLAVAWDRVRGNRGARSAGIDGVRPRDLAPVEQEFLARLRRELKAGTFTPLPVRQRMIPKGNGKLRSLGIPTGPDGAVRAQAAPRADLRGGFPPVLLRVPPETAGTRRRRRDSHAGH